MDVARAAVEGSYLILQKQDVHMEVQCCVHLNQALIIERSLAEARRYEIVNVMGLVSCLIKFCGPQAVYQE